MSATKGSSWLTFEEEAMAALRGTVSPKEQDAKDTPNCNAKRAKTRPVVREEKFSYEMLAKDLALEEQIDAKIDKDLLALGKIKTMKQILFTTGDMLHPPVKQIEGTARE